jgi:hypothetical protein
MLLLGDLSAAKLGEALSFRPPLPRRGDPHETAEHVQRHAQAVGDHRVGPPGGRELGDKAATVAHARAFDDDPGHDRPRVRADPVLGFPQPVPGLKGDVGLGQTVAGSEAGRDGGCGAAIRRPATECR